MLQGPAALTSSCYRLSAEAVKKDKYVLVGTFNQGNVEGVWEHTFSRNVKSHLTFLAGVTRIPFLFFIFFDYLLSKQKYNK